MWSANVIVLEPIQQWFKEIIISLRQNGLRQTVPAPKRSCQNGCANRSRQTVLDHPV